MLYFTKSIFMS